VAKPGDIVRVKVLEVDAPRKRISLSMRLDDEAVPKGERQGAGTAKGQGAMGRRRSAPPRSAKEESGGGALADALRRAGLGGGKGS
jgi:uncharacterized protein